MIEKLASSLQKHLNGFCPDTLIILGSGLGGLAGEIENPAIVNYADMPELPATNVSGHKGRFIAGIIGRHKILCMQGRFHLYEGHNPQIIKNLLAAFKLIGIKQLIATNAAGSLRTDFEPGTLMLIEDHINFSGKNPLLGMDDEKYGPRFPAMNNAYDAALRKSFEQTAQKAGIELKKGVYLMALGPNFETPAEIRAFRILGGDAVGMSTVPEVIAAVYAGIKVLGISVITNFGAGLCSTPPSHEETLASANVAGKNLTALVKKFLEEN